MKLPFPLHAYVIKETLDQSRSISQNKPKAKYLIRWYIKIYL